MKISVVIPTHRASLSAIARVCEAGSLDPSRFEVIVRDNSEDASKVQLLQRIESESLRLHIAENLGAIENISQAVRLASGNFAIVLADDDWISVKGLEKLYTLAESAAVDSSVSLLTGTYFVEMSSGYGFLRYPPAIESINPMQRVAGYVEANAPNVLYYSVVKRASLIFCMDLLERMPYKFSFHDILAVLAYLALGRAVQTEHVVYFYDQSEWETQAGTLAKDRAWYRSAGLPIELDRLHWLICGLEGALLLRSNTLAEQGASNTHPVADFWFAAMFGRFRNWKRDQGWSDNAVNSAARSVQKKWTALPEANLNELLIDVCDVIELSDRDGADRYFRFWSAL